MPGTKGEKHLTKISLKKIKIKIIKYIFLVDNRLT